MEPNVPSPGAGSPETAPSPPNIETGPNQQPEVGQVEAAPQPAAPEVDRPAGEQANQNQGVPLAQPLQPIQPTATDVQTQTDDIAKQVVSDAPALANDVDVLEKEWVDKAKQIVSESADDPYKQNHRVSILKADYMKKRYGKDIKIPEDKPAKA